MDFDDTSSSAAVLSAPQTRDYQSTQTTNPTVPVYGDREASVRKAGFPPAAALDIVKRPGSGE